jgi:hypothetical protein
MKKHIIYLGLLFITQTGFAQRIVLDNATIYPIQDKNTKIAIQWAANAEEMQIQNRAIIYALALNTKSLQILNQTGKVNIDIPKNVQYFRILVWLISKDKPDLLTNWVNIIENKNYTLHQDQLAPAALISGIGC